MLAPSQRRTWAPRGRSPVLKVTDPHGRISVISAITFIPERRQANLLFRLLPDNANFNGALTLDFLRQIQARVRRPITLVWDAVPFHCSAPVTDYLDSHSRMLVEEFPPYASELNPVDNVWSYIKFGRLANYAPCDLTQLRETVTSELLRVQKRPDLLHGFLRRTGLSLD
jgi:transposase